MPVAEQIMEAHHGYVQHRARLGKRKRRAASTVSLAAGRMKELGHRLQHQPCFYEALSENMNLVRNPRHALHFLGLTTHPRAAPLCYVLQNEEAAQNNILPHASALWPALKDIVYRLSAEDQYRPVTEIVAAQQQVARETAKLRRKCVKHVPPNREGSRAANVHELMTLHLNHACHKHGAGFLLSTCAGTDPASDFQTCIAALEDHIHASVGAMV